MRYSAQGVIEVPHKHGGNDVFPGDTHMFIIHSARLHWACSPRKRDVGARRLDSEQSRHRFHLHGADILVGKTVKGETVTSEM